MVFRSLHIYFFEKSHQGEREGEKGHGPWHGRGKFDNVAACRPRSCLTGNRLSTNLVSVRSVCLVYAMPQKKNCLFSLG